MFKNVLWAVAGGLAVALTLPLVTGCSTSGGCRMCRKEPPGPAPAVAGPTAGTAGLPAASPAPAVAAPPFGGQRTCPVTGEELGSMGKPVPVTVKGQTVYVCCRGCAAKAQADPDKTLAAVTAERGR